MRSVFYLFHGVATQKNLRGQRIQPESWKSGHGGWDNGYLEIWE